MFDRTIQWNIRISKKASNRSALELNGDINDDPDADPEEKEGNDDTNPGLIGRIVWGEDPDPYTNDLARKTMERKQVQGKKDKKWLLPWRRRN